jgi:chemotaxis protein MotB
MTTRVPAPQRSIPSWDESAPWLITLADLVFVLLCIFVLNLRRQDPRPSDAAPASAAAAAGSPTALAPTRAPEGAPLHPAADVTDALHDIFRTAGAAVEIESQRGAVTVHLRESVSFPSGSADLFPDVLPLLDAVGALLEAHPELSVETTGHTDDVPIATSLFPSNWELSAARAAAVARRLVASAFIDPQRIRIAGYAEHHPLDYSGTSEGRARNRRVEIRFSGTPLPSGGRREVR